MSFQSTRWLCQPGIATNATEYAVLAVLAHHADANGRSAYPSQRTISEITGCSARTVRRKLADLEARGVIRRGNQGHVAHYPPAVRPVVWDLSMAPADASGAPKAPERAPEPTPDTTTMAGHPDQDPRTQCPKSPDTGVRQSVNNQSINHSGGEVRERYARTRVKPLPENLIESDLSWTTRDNPRCRAHAHLPAHAHQPCGACGAVRREMERRDAAADERRKSAHEARRAAIAACSHCDEHGMVQIAHNTVARCSHNHDSGMACSDHTPPSTPPAPGAPPRRQTTTPGGPAGGPAHLGDVATLAHGAVGCAV